MQLEIRGQFYSDTINVDVVTGVARKPNIENETGNKGQTCYCCDELLGRGFGGVCGGPKM